MQAVLHGYGFRVNCTACEQLGAISRSLLHAWHQCWHPADWLGPNDSRPGAHPYTLSRNCAGVRTPNMVFLSGRKNWNGHNTHFTHDYCSWVILRASRQPRAMAMDRTDQSSALMPWRKALSAKNEMSVMVAGHVLGPGHSRPSCSAGQKHVRVPGGGVGWGRAGACQGVQQ